MGQNIFNSVKLQRPKRNVFDLTHDVKYSMDMGWLTPNLLLECVPGDSFNIGCDSLMRLAPMVAPMMHRVDQYQHYFFVPYRLLWKNWENFITNTKVAGVVPGFPTFLVDYDVNWQNPLTNSSYSKLFNYLGIPMPSATIPGPQVVSAMPMAAYMLIYNEFYRDQNLQAKKNFELIDGDNTANLDLLNMVRRCWEHDQFTAALPFAQKGDAVSIPLLGDAPVKAYDPAFPGPGFYSVENPFGGPAGSGANIAIGIEQSDDPTILNQLYADLGAANVTTINDLRLAFALQSWLERNALGGTRYAENIYAHFGVKPQDARLQRPEYITGARTPIVISEVLNTSDTTSAPQGNMAGHGVGVMQGRYGSYFCQEHGVIIGLCSVMPKTAYQDGLAKMWTKTVDFTQYYWPKFANIGEQEVKEKEIYMSSTNPEGVWGYTPRYSEYRFMPNRVAGDFQTSLSHWHMGRQFTAMPPLNAAFVESQPTDRVFAVTGANIDNLYVQTVHKIRAIRPMPKYATPSQV